MGEDETANAHPEPGVLYHYTTAEGFLGMCESNEIWFTHIRHLNDPGEGDYFERFVSRYLDRRRASNADESREVIDRVAAAARYGVVGDPTSAADDYPYVFCLSEHDDSLGQWRAYADLSGLSVGFSVSRYRDWLNTVESLPHVEIVQAIYDEATQTEMLEAVVNPLIDGGADFMRCYSELGPLRLCFKDPGFREEKEWRMVVRAHEGERYRAVRGELVPYVALPWIRVTHSQYETVSQVIVGPLADYGRTEPVVRRMLGFGRSMKDSYRVVASKVPYRR